MALVKEITDVFNIVVLLVIAGSVTMLSADLQDSRVCILPLTW